MAWSVDSRIPVTIAADWMAADWPDLDQALGVGPATAVLAETPAPPSPASAVAFTSFEASGPHTPGCPCCAGREPAAVALDRLFQARVRGECGWFQRVLVVVRTPAGRDAVARALGGDALTVARFRAAG